MDNEDERNVDEQLDEQQAKLEERRRAPLIENHSNNARIEPPAAGDPRKKAAASPVAAKASGVPVATTVTEAAKGTEGTTVTGAEPEG